MGRLTSLAAVVGRCGSWFIGFLRNLCEQMFPFLLYHRKWLLVQNYVELGEIGGILMLGGWVWTTKECERTRKARKGGIGDGGVAIGVGLHQDGISLSRALCRQAGWPRQVARCHDGGLGALRARSTIRSWYQRAKLWMPLVSTYHIVSSRPGTTMYRFLSIALTTDSATCSGGSGLIVPKIRQL